MSARNLAILLAFAALVPLGAVRFHLNSGVSGEASVSRGVTATYSLGDPAVEARVLALALGVLVAAGAAGLWRARRGRARGAAVLVAALGLALTPTATAMAVTRTEPLPASAVRAIRPGMSADQVRAIAGRPAGTGEAVTRSGREIECLAYPRQDEFGRAWAFCFDDADRLVAVPE